MDYIDEKTSKELSEKVTEQIVSQIRTRVPKGEKYWSIDKYGSIQEYLECGSVMNDYHYESLIYFHTEEETRAMRDKLRAVLKGADVIEMPSEEDIKERLNMIIPTQPVEPWCVEGYCKHIIGFVKSKIVK